MITHLGVIPSDGGQYTFIRPKIPLPLLTEVIDNNVVVGCEYTFNPRHA